MRIEEGFQPVPIVEGNPYTTDPALPGLLKRLLPPDVFQHVHEDMERFGGGVLTTMRELCKRATPPEFIQYDPWGRRVDELRTSEGWRGLKDIFHREGLVAIAYERRFQEHSRPYGFAKLLIAAADSDVADCPMSMTDGVARVLELTGSPALQRDILSRLVSRDPDQAYTAGQWMTERPGGSDISRTETLATPVHGRQSQYGPEYTLDGFKWFSSATDSDVALALGRTGRPEDGSRGLSLFLVPTECGVASENGSLRLRLMTPAIKGFAAEKCATAMEECMACLGGEGYMEENGISKSISDGLVEKIWEGTVNVLSLDLLRAIEKSDGLNAFIMSCPDSLAQSLSGPLISLRLGLGALADAYRPPDHPLLPRPALLLFAYIASSLYLLEHTIWAFQTFQPAFDIDVEVFRRWVVEGGLHTALESMQMTKSSTQDRVRSDASIVYGSRTAGGENVKVSARL